MIRHLLGIAAVLGVATWPTTLGAAEPEVDARELLANIKALKARLDQQSNRLAELEARLAGQQDSLARVAKDIAEDAAKRSSGPKWLDNLTFYGDLRLRYRGYCYSGEDRNDKPGSDKPSHTGRFRLRFGVKKTWLDDQVEVGFRLASGATSDPTSSDLKFDDHFSKKNIWIDQAYARYSPDWLKGLTIIGGKMPNPLICTELIWDGDLNPEGVWAQYKRAVGSVEPFVNVGYFVLDDNYASPHGSTAGDYTIRDVILVTYQVGADWKITKDVKWTVAGTYYDFDHYDVSYRTAGGNHVTDGRLVDFRTINLLNRVSFRAFDLPVSVFFDWVHNCGDNDRARQYDAQSDGYSVGFAVGRTGRKGDWSFGYRYAYIEANSTPGALNELEFGSSNRKGHVWSATYNLMDWLTLNGKVYWTEPVTGSNEDDRDLMTQVDLIWSF